MKRRGWLLALAVALTLSHQHSVAAAPTAPHSATVICSADVRFTVLDPMVRRSLVA